MTVRIPSPPHGHPESNFIRCEGTRLVEGDDEPCAPGCYAHYDGNVREDDNWGDSSWAPFPNDVLVAPHLLAQTNLLASSDLENGQPNRLVSLYVTDLFVDNDGAPQRAWLVAVTVPDVEGHLVCAFEQETNALRWFALAQVWPSDREEAPEIDGKFART
jgi:hypothetical protein